MLFDKISSVDLLDHNYIMTKRLAQRQAFSLSRSSFEESMAIAVPVEHAKAPQVESRLGISLGIEFHQLHPV